MFVSSSDIRNFAVTAKHNKRQSAAVIFYYSVSPHFSSPALLTSYYSYNATHFPGTVNLYDFSLDFLSSLDRILSTGRVVTTHLHSNPSDRHRGIFSDSHQSLDRFGMPWKEAIWMIEESGANMILETVEDPVHNLELLFS